MDLSFQSGAIADLARCADAGSHSILLSGLRGIGKTHLASMFSDMIGSEVFESVSPKAADLRDIVDEAIQMNVPHVICVEDLDDATGSASQILLKCFEEPTEHLHMVITCTSIERIPATIVSRAHTIQMKPPSPADLDSYAKSKDERKYDVYRKYKAYKSCKTLRDIDEVMSYNLSTLGYLDRFGSAKCLKGPIGQVAWGFSHDDSNNKVNPELALRILLSSVKDIDLYRNVLEAMQALELGRVSEVATLTRLVLRSR